MGEKELDALQKTTWFFGKLDELHRSRTVSEAFLDQPIGDLPIKELLELSNRTLPELIIMNRSTGSAPESKVSRLILKMERLKGIGYDFDWPDIYIDDYIKAIVKVRNASTLGEMGSDIMKIEYKLEAALEHRDLEEINEVMVDSWCSRLEDVANILLHPIENTSDGIIMSSDGIINPDMKSYKGIVGEGKRLFERREHKTLPVIMEHWENIHQYEYSLKDLANLSESARGMFTQGYASSTLTEDNCRVVVMGHPALYRIGYIQDCHLILSRWRSCNPDKIVPLLLQFFAYKEPILQGNMVAELLALAYKPEERLDAFLRTRNPYVPPIPPPPTTTVLLMSLGATGEDVGWQQLQLEGKMFSGCGRSITNQIFSLSFPDCIKDGRVWKNEDAVAKLVTECELKAHEDLSGLEGIPYLFGSFTIQKDAQDNYKQNGKIISIAQNVGHVILDGQYDSVEFAVYRILVKMHQRGWHHHDVASYNIIRGAHSSIWLTDFEFAVRATECLAECPDWEYMQGWTSPTLENCVPPPLDANYSEPTSQLGPTTPPQQTHMRMEGMTVSLDHVEVRE